MFSHSPISTTSLHKPNCNASMNSASRKRQLCADRYGDRYEYRDQYKRQRGQLGITLPSNGAICHVVEDPTVYKTSYKVLVPPPNASITYVHASVPLTVAQLCDILFPFQGACTLVVRARVACATYRRYQLLPLMSTCTLEVAAADYS